MRVPETLHWLDSASAGPNGALRAPGAEGLAGSGGQGADALFEEKALGARKAGDAALAGTTALERLYRLRERAVEDGFQHDYRARDFAEIYDGASRQILDEALEGVEDPEAREQAARLFARWEARTRKEVVDRARFGEADEAEQSTLAVLGRLLRLAERADTLGDSEGMADIVGMARAVVAGKTAAGVFSPGEGQALLERWSAQVSEAVWRGRIGRAESAAGLLAVVETLSREGGNFAEAVREELLAGARERLFLVERGETVLRAFGALAARFSESPEDAAEYLEKEENARALGLGRGEATRLAVVFAARAREEAEKEERRREKRTSEEESRVWEAMGAGDRTRAALLLAASTAIPPARAARTARTLAKKDWTGRPVVRAGTLAAIRKGETRLSGEVWDLLGHGLSLEDVSAALRVLEAERESWGMLNYFALAEERFFSMLAEQRGVGAEGAEELFARFRESLSGSMERAGLLARDPETLDLAARFARGLFDASPGSFGAAPGPAPLGEEGGRR
jgi:hypothetical protein